MKKTIIKGITLMLFIGLLGSFVMYRAGYLMKNDSSVIFSTSRNEVDTINVDSSKQKTVIMPSSKVLILTEGEPIKHDSLQPVLKLDSATLKEVQIMSGSKSGIIFKPDIKIDSVKSKKENQ